MAKKKPPAKKGATKTYGPTVGESLGKLPQKFKFVSSLEATFATLWKRHGTGPAPITQFYFAKHIDKPRDYRFDCCWPESRVAVEIDGGTRGRSITCHQCGATVRAKKKDGTPGQVMMVPHMSHGSAQGIQNSCEKNNLAVELGWVILRYTSIDFDERPLQMIEQVSAVVLSRQTSPAIRQADLF